MASKNSFKFKHVQLYKNDRLGVGTFGVVCKARCDKLECAAKLLHPQYFDVTELDVSSGASVRKFHKEYDFLKQLRSPYIIQHLGRWIDPESRLPVLLMELMNENLTAFLKRHQGQLPYIIQVDICSDVSQALAYLHSNNIIHGDLSSNNVFIFAGRRARVSDFGMSKLAPRKESTKIYAPPPGTNPYMPPEASSPYYTEHEKLDIFSFGVLTLQIITGRPPNPVVIESRRKTPQLATEVEHRMGDIDFAPTSNSLLRVAISCMQDAKDNRPSAQELCTRLDMLKPGYKQHAEHLHVHSSTDHKVQPGYKQHAEHLHVHSSTDHKVQAEKSMHSGTLLKSVDRVFSKKWRAYFFKITDGEISFFSVNDTKHTVPRGKIKAEDIENVDIPAVKGASFPMAIYFRGKSAAHDSPWILNADSEVARRTWMKAIRSSMPSTSDNRTALPHHAQGAEPLYENPITAPDLPPRPSRRHTTSSDAQERMSYLYEQMESFSSRVLVTEEDDDDVYLPRPEWAKAKTSAPTDPKRQYDEAMWLKSLYILRSAVTDLERISQGEFGEVFKAILNKGSPVERIVAVKTIKKTLVADQENFLREMSVMSNLMHPNIVRLHGIVNDEYNLSPWIVLEYLPRGDLKTFLTEKEQPPHKLMKYMLDVAMGMHYISEKGLVHRDLAARNVLVGDDEVCKVSDFGLLRELPKDYTCYHSQSVIPWPIRWMAPESLGDRLYSQATDVWSFGVLQWEMFNPKVIPYDELETNYEVAAKIVEGHRLSTPRGCPPVIAQMMKACWHKVPTKRPSFLAISTVLRQELP